jgi:hypothetical protein
MPPMIDGCLIYKVYRKLHGLWHAPNLFYRFKCESKVKITKEQGVEARSLACSTLKGREVCWSSEMGTRKSDKHQLLTWTCTNQTTSWLVHSLSTFGARKSHWQTQTHKTHHGPDLGEAPTFPLIIYSMPLHEAHIQMIYYPRTTKWESWNSQSWDSCNFGTP